MGRSASSEIQVSDGLPLMLNVPQDQGTVESGRSRGKHRGIMESRTLLLPGEESPPTQMIDEGFRVAPRDIVAFTQARVIRPLHGDSVRRVLACKTHDARESARLDVSSRMRQNPAMA